MSAYTTIKITRRTALSFLLENLYRANDETLANVVDEFLRERLYNCRIVDEGVENDDQILYR